MATGQQKMHTVRLVNPDGEVLATAEITQEHWRTNGKVLREAGWQRDDAGEGEPVDTGGGVTLQNIVWGT